MKTSALKVMKMAKMKIINESENEAEESNRQCGVNNGMAKKIWRRKYQLKISIMAKIIIENINSNEENESVWRRK